MLWAVHIDDGIMKPEWCLAGFVWVGLLYGLGAWKIRQEEIPRIALLTAVFFVVSTIHIPIPLAATSVHLLGSGLVGVMLGRRCGLAVTVGLLLQAFLLGHGGRWTLGVNSFVISLPALAAWFAFRGLNRLPWIARPWFRSFLVGIAIFTGLVSLIYSCRLLLGNSLERAQSIDPLSANALVFNPWLLTGALLLTAVLTWLEVRMENAPEFPLGLLIGEATVLATVGLNFLVRLWGAENAEEAAAFPLLLMLVAHVPIAVIEGLVLGVTVGFLTRVKPELLGPK